MNESTANDIRLLLIDDHMLFRESLGRLLQSEPGIDVVASCSSIAEALAVLKSRDVDLILLDLDLGTENGADLLDALPALGFKGKIVLVTAGVNERDLPAMIRKGIAGVVMKHNPPGLLVQGIRDAMNGKALFDQEVLRRALSDAGAPSPEAAQPGLTAREKLVLTRVFEGLTNKEIADRMQVSESAVKACLQQLFTKTGVRTRSQLVRVALEKHLHDL